MAAWWREALGGGREPSPDQVAAIAAPATGRHSVDAGAGTGKTSTLALRALYLIEAGHVAAEQIVVVTFTKKAAAEVGSRIADTIDRALANGAPFARDGRGVNCTTIHALAAGILREFAFDSGAAVPVGAITDGAAYGIFHAAFRDLLAGSLGVDTGAFPVAEMNLDILERDLGKLALRLKNHGITPAAFDARALAQADALSQQMWGQLWSSGKNAGKRIELDPKKPLTPTELAVEAERERANIGVVSALFVEFDRRLAARNAATYGDLIGLATRLLNDRPRLVTRLRDRWRYVLLDESQDTSELQLAFIETLFGKPGDPGAAGMMPVGDARQAIYGFNGADEHVMARLAEVADGRHSLVVNRRSPQEVVDAGHAVLAAVGIVDRSTGKLEASAGSGGLECVRVENFGVVGEPIKEHVKREADAIAREVDRLLRDGSAKTNDIAILVRRRTHAAAYVRALNEHGISAALDRRSSLLGTDEIRDALAWMSVLLDLGNRPALVRILQSPLVGLCDAAMIGLAGRNDWVDRFLDAELSGAMDPDTRVRLDRVRALLTDLLPAVALPLRTATANILAQLPLAASYARQGGSSGAQAIVNLHSFELLAGEFAAEMPGARLRDFVDDVLRRILYEDEPPEAELDLDGVRVLTIHQAKGLEWPFVFVACSTKAQYGNADPTDRVVKYDLRSGAFALKNDVDGRETLRWLMVGCEHDPTSGERARNPEQTQATKREQARVFYVALTRAQRRVYVTAPAPASANGAAPYLASIRAWAESIEPGVNLCFAQTVGVPAEPLPRKAPELPRISERAGVVPKPVRSTFRPRVSFTAIAAFETCPRQARLRYRLLLPDLRDARPRFVGLDSDENAPVTNAARLGSLTHRALELWGTATIEARPIALDDAFADAALEFADATPDEADRALASMRQAVQALRGYVLLAVETPFEIAFGETRVEGVMDLVARDPNGRLVVIDYKTGRTDDEHYNLQMALYRRVAGLRYPGEQISAAILRLTPESGTFTFATPLSDHDLDRSVAEAGRFESDVAKVGSWCDFCAYRGSPCLAPLGQVG